MDISVIFVAYRTPADLLRESMTSVIESARTARVEVELIVVDNGGAAEIMSDLPPARIVGTGENLGFGSAVNTAVRVAQGEYILLMNPDSSVTAETVHELVTAAQAAPKPSLIGALLLHDGRPQVHAYNLWRGTVHLQLRKRAWARHLDAIVASQRPTAVTRLCGAGLFARREDLARLGPFNDDYFLYGEDVDLSLRAKADGFTLLLCPRAIVNHDAGSSSTGASAIVERARTDAHLRILADHFGVVSSFIGRAEIALAALVLPLIKRTPAGRAARDARLAEVRRWGWRRKAERYDPANSAIAL